MNQVLILKKPIITEKSLNQAQNGKFTFLVSKKANKNQIRKIIQKHFKVDVIDIKTLKISGKTKRFGSKRLETQMPDYKKAIATLKKGQKINLFEIKESSK